MGCHNAGGDKNVVRKIFNDIFTEFPVFIYDKDTYKRKEDAREPQEEHETKEITAKMDDVHFAPEKETDSPTPVLPPPTTTNQKTTFIWADEASDNSSSAPSSLHNSTASLDNSSHALPDDLSKAVSKKTEKKTEKKPATWQAEETGKRQQQGTGGGTGTTTTKVNAGVNSGVKGPVNGVNAPVNGINVKVNVTVNV